MQAYRVKGTFPNGRIIQPFTQDVVAGDEADAIHRVQSTLGSRHRVPRRKVVIESVEKIKPADSSEAKVIAAFGLQRTTPQPVAVESSDEEE